MATIKKSSTTRTSAKSTSTKRTTKTSSITGSVAIDHVFENGVKVSGTLEQLETIAKAMGLKLVGIKTEYTRGFYSSESKGLIKISSMNEYHIRRALLKRSKDYFT
jgi:predicted amino acid racemase